MTIANLEKLCRPTTFHPHNNNLPTLKFSYGDKLELQSEASFWSIFSYSKVK